MGNLHLVTGYAGEAHITADDQGSLNAAVFGEGQFVLNRGNKLSASVVTNNQIKVLDGDILMQGRHIRLNDGTYIELTIENGAQGYYRNDLIVARYTKDSSTGVEDCNLVVIKGTASTSAASDPEYTSGDIINGNALQNDMPLYRVPIDGLNVQELVPMFTVIESTLIDLLGHTHEITDIDKLSTVLNEKVPVARTVAGFALSSDITVAQLLTALGVLPLTGGTMTGSITIDALAEKRIRFKNDGTGTYTHNCTIYQGSADSGAGIGAYDTANQRYIWMYNDVKNYLQLGGNDTSIVLMPGSYGDELPDPGTPGRIFFKRVK